MTDPLEHPASLVARNLFAAISAEDWMGAASLVDPQASAAFHRSQAKVYSASDGFRSHLATHPEDHPGIPAEVKDASNLFLRAIWRTPTTSAFVALDPLVSVARFLEFRFKKRPEVTRPAWRVLGVVSQDPDLAHATVVPDPYVERDDGSAYVDVLTLRRTADGWRALLNGGLVYNAGGHLSLSLSSDDMPEGPGAG